MKIACHQPTYIPWLGYFYKMSQVDTFVVLDDVQLQRGRGYGTRTAIKTEHGAKWLSVPCKKKGNRAQRICDVKIDNSTDWAKKHQDTLHHYYARAPYYSEFKDLLEVYDQKWELLIYLNLEFILRIAKKIGVDPCIVGSSTLQVSRLNKQDLILGLCTILSADEYYSGNGARNYQDEKIFNAHKVKLTYTDYYPVEYKQLWGAFIYNLSILDVLFNCGIEKTKLLVKGD